MQDREVPTLSGWSQTEAFQAGLRQLGPSGHCGVQAQSSGSGAYTLP